MGRKKKYATEAERQAAKKEQNKRSAAKSRGKGKAKEKSFFKIIESKLSSAAETVESVTDDKVETPKGGEPFANLPPLDLPSSDASPSEGGTADDAGTPSASADTKEASAPTGEASKAEPKKGVVIDVSEIEAMLGPFVESGVRQAGQYAMENGFFALGDPFPRLAREAACIIIRKRAQDIGLDEEEYAAYLLAGIVGVNGTQAYRAYKKVASEKKAPAKESSRDVTPPIRAEEPDAVREREGHAPVPGALVVRKQPEPDNRFRPASPSIV